MTILSDSLRRRCLCKILCFFSCTRSRCYSVGSFVHGPPIGATIRATGRGRGGGRRRTGEGRLAGWPSISRKMWSSSSTSPPRPSLTGLSARRIIVEGRAEPGGRGGGARGRKCAKKISRKRRAFYLSPLHWRNKFHFVVPSRREPVSISPASFNFNTRSPSPFFGHPYAPPPGL